MRYRRFAKKYIVRIDKGEEIITSLKHFIDETGVKLGSVTAIGAADKITMGIFKAEEKKYYPKKYEGDFEIIGLNGNLSVMNGEPYIHLHITISDEDGRAYGGHLNAAVISGTCELIVSVLEGELEKEFDEASGLNIFKF